MNFINYGTISSDVTGGVITLDGDCTDDSRLFAFSESHGGHASWLTEWSDTLSTHAIASPGVLQLSRWGVLDDLRRAGTPTIRTAVYHYGGDRRQIDIRPRGDVDGLYAPRRTLLDATLVDAAVEEFLETHPEPATAPSDSTNMLRLEGLEALLRQVLAQEEDRPSCSRQGTTESTIFGLAIRSLPERRSLPGGRNQSEEVCVESIDHWWSWLHWLSYRGCLA